MTQVAILWHLHQPHYGDPRTGDQLLPWVRLHALKDYFGMVELLREFPSIRLTFNLVPSLVVQLDALAGGQARDRYLDLSLRPAADLTVEEREFVVANFFHAQRARMIEPYRRYRELLALREEAARGTDDAPWRAAAARFTEADLRDLQVWHKLVWIDPFYAGDPRVKALLARGRDYREADKARLAEVEREIVRRVIPAYRQAQERGQVELSTSPFYHPILPLLCDTDVYTRLHPHARVMPPFRHPEDAALQIARGIECHERFFGRRPTGLWPPEGSVSDAIVPLVANHGLGWMATDEVVLARSRRVTLTRDGGGHVEQPETLYRPYRIATGGGEVACLFRDHVLSDLVGFTYSSWPSDAAAQDLVNRIAEAGRRYAARTGGGDAVVGIMLDGENAWEHYEGGGRPFLRTLYRLLSNHPEIRTVTLAEATRDAAMPVLESIWPGSWADGDFSIWIGHEDDRKGWSQLARAHRALTDAAPRADAAALALARESLLVAEGSDWFWWYGDDHASDQDLEYDTLFRAHVRAVYDSLGLPVPEALYFTNITAGVKAVEVVAPDGPIEPALSGDGQDPAWTSAGYPIFRRLSGTMRQSAPGAETHVEAIRFGFGRDRLFVRIDASTRLDAALRGGLRVALGFLHPPAMRAVAGWSDGRLTCWWERRTNAGEWLPQPDLVPEAAAGTVLELALPLRAFERRHGAEIAFYVALERNGVELGRYPSQVAVKSHVPDGD